jgi:soluble lytic murein transglycosylase-like protein
MTTPPDQTITTASALDRLAFVMPTAKLFGLQPTLVAAVCEQESGWNPWAIRFEPAFEARYIRPSLPSAPTTRELTEAMSFGLMQIMGEVAIELGWKGKFLTELCDPETAVLYGCRKLQRCFLAHRDDEPSLLAYNGGGNPLYAAQVLARVKNYEGQGAQK